ncbi:MAG: phytanoyl-CoA dioxygenase family protein [Actinobacteria bacterium]|nr:MAG: phytanoyl-CoA dioxygenase family protein [Actinomycetota bacterium]
MITRRSGYLSLSADPAPAATEQLQREGYVVLPGVLSPAETKALGEDIERVFEEYPPDERVPGLAAEHWVPFRYEMLNRSEACQRAVAHPSILQVIEPLLGEDCHVIANTAWRQPEAESDHGGRFWHIDSGPHVPRDPAVAWDERIPYPVFAVAAHLFIWDCPIEAGATGIIPGSHTSGQAPPVDRMGDDDLEWREQGAVPVVAAAGDVALFVSDVWHRRLASGPHGPGRFFLQCHYGRRDLAQRLRPTSAANHLSPEAVARAQTKRERTLIGLHRPFFYDG